MLRHVEDGSLGVHARGLLCLLPPPTVQITIIPILHPHSYPHQIHTVKYVLTYMNCIEA